MLPQDVVLVGPSYSVNVMTHSSLSNPDFLAQAVDEYNNNRTGILTNVGGDIAGNSGPSLRYLVIGDNLTHYTKPRTRMLHHTFEFLLMEYIL